ncbi:DUF2490 domain-containing protein [Sphingomonas sp. 3P27F8]|uniref:DUF2490 domain-containing protein n=1 Tax=Sphingomonas sp. 3P27F8 TaxID=2502213 RepID=UPI0010F905D2|nr:DUF2490 domain-containing protein [Sphingomonas sp. 3P27F8]
MHKIAFAIALASSLFPSASFAETRQDEAIWVNATVMGRIDGGLVFFAEVQPRIVEGASRLGQVIYRPAIGWQFSNAVTAYQGYARVVEPHKDGGEARIEDRLFQQITWNVGKIGSLEVQSRTRLEQRWRSDAEGMSLRVREMLRFEYPLADAERRVAALGWVEGFAGLKSARWGGVSGFDQLRTFAGLEIPLPGKSTIEAGYLNQTRHVRGGQSDMSHIASLTLFVRP